MCVCVCVFVREKERERERERERLRNNADKILGCHIGLSNSKQTQRGQIRSALKAVGVKKKKKRKRRKQSRRKRKGWKKNN